MKLACRHRLMLGTAAILPLICVVAQVPAYAQSSGVGVTQVSVEAGAAQGASASDSQVASGAPSSALGEIVVTARRRSESLQNVPISVSAVSSDTIRTANIRTTQDLGRLVPGITVTDQSGAATPFIRGIGAISGNPGFEAAVATYVDGVYIGSNYGSKVSVVDVDHIEVLKGPQGTLFGRNSVGGLINIVTRQPQQELSGEVRLSYGNYDTVGADMYLTGGLTENLAASVSGSYFNRGDGPGRNIFSGVKTYIGKDQNIRGKLLFEPSDSTRITLAADYRKLNTREGVSMNLFPDNLAIDGQTGPADNYYDSLGREGALRVKSWGVWGKIVQEFGAFDVTSLTAYRHERNYHRRDLDLGPNQLAEFSWRPTYRTFEQELQFTSASSSSIKWVAGLFFLKDKTGYDHGEFRVFGPLVGGNFGYRYVLHTTSMSAFAEATAPLGASTNLTIGGRYTIDKRKVTGQLNVYPNVGDPVDALTPPPVAEIVTDPQKKTYKTPTWRVILDHQLAQNNMIYASYSRGFKAGNINLTTPTNKYDPEKLDAFEVGYKGDISSILRVNLSSFYYKYSDQQVTFFSGVEITSNAGKSTIYGGELEVNVVPTSNLRIRGSLAYLHAKFDEYDGALCTYPQPTGGQSQVVCDVGGNYMTRAPKFTAMLEPTLTIPSSAGDFVVSVNYAHSSKYYSDVQNLKSQKTLDLIGARASWQISNTPMTVAVYGENLTNKKYWAFANPAFSGYYYSAAMPRTYGIEISVGF